MSSALVKVTKMYDYTCDSVLAHISICLNQCITYSIVRQFQAITLSFFCVRLLKNFLWNTSKKYVDLVRICREAAKKYVFEWNFELEFLSVVGLLGPIFNKD